MKPQPPERTLRYVPLALGAGAVTAFIEGLIFLSESVAISIFLLVLALLGAIAAGLSFLLRRRARRELRPKEQSREM